MRKHVALAPRPAPRAQVSARQEAERDFLELKASLTQQRMQIEVRMQACKSAFMHA